LHPVDIKRRWRENWKSAQVVNFHLAMAARAPMAALSYGGP